MKVRVIATELIDQLSDQQSLYDWVKEALTETARGNAVLPLRQALQIDPAIGAIGMMPGYLASAKSAGVKLVSLVPPERRKGSSHLGLMVLYEEDGLLPIALLDGSRITAIRTAAASAVATDALAREDSKVLTILGSGEQAESHVIALATIRNFDTIQIWGRSKDKAQALATRLIDELPSGISINAADNLSAAISSADVICTVTGASEPVLAGDLVSPGTHVNLVGSSHAGARETDTALLLKSRVFLDFEGSAKAQAGEILKAVSDNDYQWSDVIGEIGEVLEGALEGRLSDQDVTVYKSLGIAAQDVITARKVFDKAVEKDLGVLIEF